jgi:hypothetical protein
VTDLVNQELLLRNEYLVAENRILKGQIKGRLRLSHGERSTLAKIGKRLGRKALREIGCIAKPDTILAWYGHLVAQKLDGSMRVPSKDVNVCILVRRRRVLGSGWNLNSVAKFGGLIGLLATNAVGAIDLGQSASPRITRTWATDRE